MYFLKMRSKRNKPLLDRGDITERYVQKAIDNIKADKPFIMIDGVIIAHAGVDDDEKKVCLSLLMMPEQNGCLR